MYAVFKIELTKIVTNASMLQIGFMMKAVLFFYFNVSDIRTVCWVVIFGTTPRSKPVIALA